ncbi:MAG: hypothetical protein GEU98_10475 [Pseudonocardiaceae bacterium]|nr:hypothetical protein [Pseudonocardiaceae bacterium]
MTAHTTDLHPLLDALPASTVAVDRIDRDTIALARLLVRLEAHVVLLATRVAPDVTAKELDSLRATGVTIAEGDDLSWAHRCLLLFAHDYTSPSAPVVQAARGAGCRITHLADLLLEMTPALTVGVTGSAGKSTTAAMIGAILRAAGRQVYLPCRHPLTGSANPNWELLEQLKRMDPNGVLVLELTSSHLEYMAHGPNIAVVTTISPDHLEWHGSLGAYLAAKQRIVTAQRPGDVAVLNADEAIGRAWARIAPGRVRLFSAAARQDANVRLAGDRLVADDATVLLARDQIRLADSYVMNALAAATAALSAGASRDAVHAGLTGFDGLAGRRELVAAANGVAVYDDSLALTPRKAIASLSSFADDSVLLLCGGEDVQDGWSVAPMHTTPDEQRLFDEFALLATRKARRVFTLGSAGDRIHDALARAGADLSAVSRAISLETAAQQAIAIARRGDNVVLAPVFEIRDSTLPLFGEIARKALNAKRAR